MSNSPAFRRLLPLAAALLLALALPRPASAADACCAAPAAEGPGLRPLGQAAAPAPAWMFMTPVGGRAKRGGGSRQFDYMFEQHLWLSGGVQVVPTGLPLTPETSYADRRSFSQAGLGLGYMVSPALRVISNWNTGLGRANVSPGNQFTVGVALRY